MPDNVLTDDGAMREAIRLAKEAQDAGELPYGAVVLSPAGVVIGRGHDRVESDSDLTSHAEMLAVRDAARHHGRSLEGCTLVSNVEPCAMCFSAAWTANVSRVIFGLSMHELSATHPDAMDEISIDATELNARTQRRLEVVGGVLHAECSAVWP